MKLDEQGMSEVVIMCHSPNGEDFLDVVAMCHSMSGEDSIMYWPRLDLRQLPLINRCHYLCIFLA